MRSTVLIVALLLIAPICVNAEQVTVYTHSSKAATFIDETGNLRGIAGAGRRAFLVELVRELMIRNNQPAVIDQLPLERGIKTLEYKPFTALFNLNRTPEREQRFQWVGPLQTDTIYFYENTESATQIASIEDARRVAAICVRSGNSHFAVLEEYQFNNLISANSYQSCWNMLKLQRVALITLGQNLVPYLTEYTQTAPSRIRNTGVPLADSSGYLGFSIDTPVELVARWQQTLDTIKESGRYQELVERYF